VGVSASLSAGNGKDDLLTWATCSPLTVSGSPGSRAYQTRCSIPRMAQWRRITRDGTYPRCTDALKPCEARKIKESESERTREGGWWWKRKKEEEKSEKRNFLNHGLFIQPHSAFGRSIVSGDYRSTRAVTVAQLWDRHCRHSELVRRKSPAQQLPDRRQV
jgi:hypothetical protein